MSGQRVLPLKSTCFLCSRSIGSGRRAGDFINGKIALFHIRCWERWRKGEEPSSVVS